MGEGGLSNARQGREDLLAVYRDCFGRDKSHDVKETRAGDTHPSERAREASSLAGPMI